jgi:transposase-like protein
MALKSHANALLTPKWRSILIDRIGSGWTITAAARAAGISRQTGSKWWARFRLEGRSGLIDRESSARDESKADRRIRRFSSLCLQVSRRKTEVLTGEKES